MGYARKGSVRGRADVLIQSHICLTAGVSIEGLGFFLISMMEVSRVDKFPQHHLLVSFFNASSRLFFPWKNFSRVSTVIGDGVPFPCFESCALELLGMDWDRGSR